MKPVCCGLIAFGLLGFATGEAKAQPAPFDVPGSGSTELLGINDLGQIVGVDGDANGDHGFLATPVPEPATLILLGIGIIGLLIWARWRKRS